MAVETQQHSLHLRNQGH